MDTILGKQGLNKRVQTEIQMSMRNMIKSKIQLVTACIKPCKVADPRSRFDLTAQTYDCFSKCQIRLSYDEVTDQ